MKKYFLAAVVAISMMTAITACGDNTDTGTVNDIVNTGTENQTENPADTEADIQSQNQSDSQVEDESDIRTENQTDTQEENETAPTEDAEPAADDNESENEEEPGGQTDMKMNVQVGDYTFTATLENNKATEELVDMMKEGPVTISMDDYSGFE